MGTDSDADPDGSQHERLSSREVDLSERHRRLAAVEDLPGLQAVGRRLIHVAERTGLHLGVVVLSIEAAPRGEWKDRERLLLWVCDLLERTLRRCDVLSRTGPAELSVVLVSDGPLAGAVDRLSLAIAERGAGAHVKVGFAAYDSHRGSTVDDLLASARSSNSPNAVPPTPPRSSACQPSSGGRPSSPDPVGPAWR
jgi:hypothetical protein